MRKQLKRWQKRLASVVAVLVLAFALVIQLGEAFPGLHIPSWDDLFVGAGLAPAQTTAEGTLEVHILDVGNADCILVRQGEATLLIDAGERGDGDRILQYLNQHGVKKLDLVIATHPHADHIGGMAKILENLPVGRMLMSFPPESATPTSATYLAMLEKLEGKAVPVTEAEPGMTVQLGTAQLEILAPLEETEEYNNLSVVTYLTFGRNHFLFMGDAEASVEKAILAAGYPVQADVLKLGHHGSKTASCEAFLQQVAPTYAVITCGEGNSYGHPHAETLERLVALDIASCRSDLRGHMLFTSDGQTVQLQCEKTLDGGKEG